MSTPIRILHLEDNPRDAELVRDLLDSAGLDAAIRRTASRAEFEQIVTQCDFDLVLLDFAVPGYNGMAALAAARNALPDVPAIVISGSLEEEQAVACLHNGATDYLLKHRLDRLGPAVERALQEATNARRRRETEKALRASEERFSAMFHSSPVGISYGSIDGHIIDANAELCAFFGYPRHEFINRTDVELQLWVKPEQRQEAFARLERDRSLRGFEASFRRQSGEVREGLVSMQLIQLGAQPQLLTTIVDITDRRALERQLYHAQRVESVGRLASGIAHDMNNILAPIMMSAPLLRLSMAEPQAEKMLAMIETCAQRGAGLVRQLLLFGRGAEGERRCVRLAEVIDEVAKMAAQTFPKAIVIAARTPPDLWDVLGDPTQLQQVVLNLWVNARDAMPDGGNLTATLKNVTLQAADLAGHPDAKPGRYVWLRVEDTGCGIPAEVADRIFDPFFTTKTAGKGTGLGLATVLGIVKGHGGFVRVQSQVGIGTAFDIFLPPVENRATDRAGENEAEAAPDGNGELIMIVDDEANIRGILRDLFMRHGYKVVTAQDGIDAVAAFAVNPQIRLVVSDLDMPAMDGIDLGRVLRQRDPQLRIIISTGVGGGSGLERRREKLATLGVSAVLTKPYTADTVLRAAHSALAVSATPANASC
jgi:two-component system, cell cycle sensor histidine kinase and response regulator CckA